MSDRSLDEFLPEATDEASDDEATDEASDDEATDEASDDEATDEATADEATADEATGEESTSPDAERAAGTDPATPTMRWTADDAPCDACGTVVPRRWRAGDAFVCDDCKEW